MSYDCSGNSTCCSRSSRPRVRSRRSSSDDAFVRGQRQERREIVGQRDLLEQFDGRVELFDRDLIGELLPDLAERGAHPVAGDRLTIVETDPVLYPLPQLGAGNLGRGRILHQIVDRGGTVAPEPGGDVTDTDVDGGTQTGDRGVTVGLLDGEQVLRADGDILTFAVDLVGLLAEDVVELLAADTDQVGMGDPRSVEPIGGL